MDSRSSQRDGRNVHLRATLEVRGNPLTAIRYLFLRLIRRIPRTFFWEDQPVRAIEVNQMLQGNDTFTIYLEYLKIFRWGFLLQGRLSLIQGSLEEVLDSSFVTQPRISLSVMDDRDHEYRALNGYIEGVKGEFRFVRGFVPCPDPKAKCLLIRLEEKPWADLDNGHSENPHCNELISTIFLGNGAEIGCRSL